MKKFLGLIVLLVALAVCAAALVACDPGSGNQATPQSIQFEDKDGADRSTFWDLGIFDYGTAYADILPSFTLNLYYSDGSTKELAAGDYTVSYIKIEEKDVPLQSMPAVPDAGYYQIVFDKDELQARMLFTVESVMRTDLTLSLSRNEWEYDEANPTPTVGGYSATDGDEPLFYCVGKAAFDALTDEQKAEYWLHVTPAYNMGEVPCTIAVGEYYAYAEIPQDNNFTVSYTAITPETAFTVKKAVLHYDSAVSSNLQAVFNYHNSGIQGKVNLGDINITTRDFSVTALKDKTGAEILGQYVWDSSAFIDADDSGTAFPARYQLDSQCEASYTVENGSIPVEVTINKGSVSQPQLLIDSYNVHSANESFGPYPGNALPYAVVNDDGGYNVRIFGEWDKNTIEITVKRLNSDGSSTTNKVTGLIGTLLDDGTYKYCLNWDFIDPAEYAVTLSLKDKTNFTWYDGTSEDSVFRFEIKAKKAIPVPTVKMQNSATDFDGVDFTVYDGQRHYVYFTDYTEGAIESTLNGQAQYPVAIADNQAFYELEPTDFGQNGKISVSVTPASEYTWADGSVDAIEYACNVKTGATFFTGIASLNYTGFTTTDDVEAARLMSEWYGATGSTGQMEKSYQSYNAAVYFSAVKDGKAEAKHIGTISNTHDKDFANYANYRTSFDIMDVTTSVPQYYSGAAEVASSKVTAQIYPDGGFESVESISAHDFFFFNFAAQIDARKVSLGLDITDLSYATDKNHTIVRIEADNVGTSEANLSHTTVYLVFRGGAYVGHEINTTVTDAEGVETSYLVQFAVTE